jgi:hypothetical protein
MGPTEFAFKKNSPWYFDLEATPAERLHLWCERIQISKTKQCETRMACICREETGAMSSDIGFVTNSPGMRAGLADGGARNQDAYQRPFSMIVGKRPENRKLQRDTETDSDDDPQPAQER